MKRALLLFAFIASTGFCGEILDQFPNPPKWVTMPARVSWPDYGITEVGLELTAGGWGGPAFSVIFNKDGTFRYDGEHTGTVGAFSVTRLGKWHGTADKDEFNFLCTYVHEIGYFSMPDAYMFSYAPDAPSVLTLVKTKDRKKVVDDFAESGPPKLVALEKLINDLMQAAKWEKN